VKNGNRLRAKTVALEDADPLRKKVAAGTRGQVVAEGAVLASYTFDVYKKPPKKTVQNVVVLSADGSKVAAGFRKGSFTATHELSPHLINIPANDMTPRRMADEARKVVRGTLGPALKGPGHSTRSSAWAWAVIGPSSRGSVEPRPFASALSPQDPPRKKIAIVGKGVTFDSGGLSLKTAQGMETMKDDMSGSAAMLAVMQAIAILKPGVEVHGYAAMTENMPSGSAGSRRHRPRHERQDGRES
jgi:leucyl aminopeptidase